MPSIGEDDEPLSFGSGVTREEMEAKELKQLRNGEYEYAENGVEELKKRHVLKFLYDERDLDIPPVGRLLNVTDDPVRDALLWHRIRTDRNPPELPPWRFHRDSDAVLHVSKRGNSRRGNSY